MDIRELTKDDVEVRVQSAKGKGVVLLLYKNARVDMNILDETVGSENWQREHYECKGNLFCRVGIRCGNEWVWKSDCGTESEAEAQKGEASDSFKRACFNWGIGRELYTSPFIWIPASKCNIKTNPKTGKHQCCDSFIVSALEIRNKRITGLTIINTSKDNAVCFSYGNNSEPVKDSVKADQTQNSDKVKSISPIQAQVNALAKELASLTGSTAGKEYKRGMAVLKLPDTSDGQLLLMVNWLKGEINKMTEPKDELDEMLDKMTMGA